MRIPLFFFIFLPGSIHVSAQQADWEDSVRYYKDKGNFTQAIYWQEKNTETLKLKAGEKDTLYAGAIINLAQLYISARNHKGAKPYYEQAVEIYKRAGGDTGLHYLASLKDLGVLFTDLGQYQQADSCLTLSLQLQKKAFGEKGLNYGATLGEMADLYRITGKYGDAETYYNRALGIIIEASDDQSNEYLSNANNLAILYYQTGKYALTEKMFLQIAGIRKKINGEDHLEYADILNNLGAIYFALGNYAAAAPCFSQALSIYEKKVGVNNPLNVGAIGNLGAVYVLQGDYPQAERLLKKQIALYEASVGTNNVEYASAINNLGQNYLRWGKNANTEQLFIQALNIRETLLGRSHPDYIQALSNLALYYTNVKKFDIADSLYKEAMRIQENNLGVRHPDYLIFAGNRVELYQLMKKYKVAAEMAQANFSGEEALLQNRLLFLTQPELLAYLKSKEMAFSMPFSSLMHYNTPELSETAYNNALLIKGFSVLNYSRLSTAIAQSRDSIVAGRWKDYQAGKSLLNRTLAQPIAKRKVNTDSLAAAVNQQEKELITKSTLFRDIRFQQNLRWTDIKNRLSYNETAIEFIRFRYLDDKLDYQYYYAALLVNAKESNPVFIKLCNERDLKIALNKFIYKADGEYDGIKTGRAGADIYKLIWQPLEKRLASASTVYFAPDGLLHNVAFAAIQDKKMQYLTDKYTLVQLTSTRQIINRDSTIYLPAVVALFGGINYNQQIKDIGMTVTADPYAYVYRQNRGGDTDSFTYLPHTLREVEEVKKQLEAQKKKVLLFTGSAATENVFRSIDTLSPDVIHVATHAFALPNISSKKVNGNIFKKSDNPLLRSGLVFAGGNAGWKGNNQAGEDDGILTALEISSVSLPNTQLAVLSACESGTGEIKGSEGVFGLQRAFKLAGVNYIISTLWLVPDKETSEFMNLFYTNWLKKKTIPQAFSLAQKAMKKKYSAPFYWAAFTLVR